MADIEERALEVTVERIETEDWSEGYPQPAEQVWQVRLSGYAAEFATETAANNFAGAIAAALREARQDGEVARYRQAFISRLPWKYRAELANLTGDAYTKRLDELATKAIENDALSTAGPLPDRDWRKSPPGTGKEP